MRLVTYNCNLVRNNSETVKNLLNRSDIVCLQELMLSKSDIMFLNHFNNDFNHISFVEDRESQGINEGRPSRGVAIFWRKCFSSNISPLLIDDSLIGVVLSFSNVKVLLMNVYLPCDKQTADAAHNYRCMLAKLKNVIEEQNVDHIIITGDFNADPNKGRFWKELLNFSQSLSLLTLNDQMPQDSFTYLCPARNTTSWLDHVLCSSQIMINISNPHVDYTSALYDHFPLFFELNLDFGYCS